MGRDLVGGLSGVVEGLWLTWTFSINNLWRLRSGDRVTPRFRSTQLDPAEASCLMCHLTHLFHFWTIIRPAAEYPPYSV